MLRWPTRVEATLLPIGLPNRKPAAAATGGFFMPSIRNAPMTPENLIEIAAVAAV
jgi:hypothetical protein